MSDAFNIYVYAVEDGYDAEIREEPNISTTGHGVTKVNAVLEVMRLAGEEDGAEFRRIEREPDGFYVEAQLTSEGVIVDRYNADGENVATFGQTYEEVLGC